MKNSTVLKKGRCPSWLFITFFMFMFLYCMPLLTISAANNSLKSQSKALSLKAQNKTFGQVFEEIKLKSGYSFFFRDDAINLEEKVSIDTDNLSVEETLDQLFRTTGNTYRIEDTQIYISKGESPKPVASLKATSSNQQKTISISGIIKDNAGLEIIGASIVVKGTTKGTMTDLDGKYTLQGIPENATLVISYIGYETQSLVVKADGVYNITLKESSTLMDEVVVVGYGTQKKANLTGSVASVGGEKLASRPITNISSALGGLSPGLSVRQSSGEPGEDGAKLKIRGSGTLTSGTDPLVIVDGMEGSMNHINPQDIETISILKDAASGAIYGSRAANGVILITTKKGSAGKVRVTLDANLSMARPTKKPKFVNDYISYMGFMNEAADNIGDKNPFSQADFDLWSAANADPNGLSVGGFPNKVAYPNTDWYDEILENSLIQTYNVGVTGGVDKATYNISLRYQNNPGIIRKSGLETYQGRINLEVKPFKILTVGTQTWFSTSSKGPADMERSNPFTWMGSTSPGIYPKYDGMYGHKVAPGESNTINNPVEHIEKAKGRNRTNRFFTTWFAKVDIIKGLSFETKINYTQNTTDKNTVTLSFPKWDFASGLKVVEETDSSNATSTYRHSKDYRITTDNVLRYNITVKNDHDLSALVGHNEYYYNKSDFRATGRGLLDREITTLDGTSPDAVGGSEMDYSMRSFFGRVNYAYKSKYLFEANIRYDGSSRFGDGKKWGTFPSVSAAWRISEEEFVGQQFKDIFQNLKLRASYGKLGNNIYKGRPYGFSNMYISTEDGAYYSFGGEQVQSLRVHRLGNSDIQWEETSVLDFGIDASFLGGRASVELDYYDKKTKGILYAPTLPGVMGHQLAPIMNLAKVGNRGVEVTLGWNDKIRDFSYGVSVNMAYNHNKVDKYQGKLVEGWVADDKGNLVWRSNYGSVGDGADEAIVEGYQIKEFRNLTVYQGDGSYFHADGTVNVNGGPQTGMIRTEDDMKWIEAMQAAGNQFLPQNGIAKNKLYYGDLIFADVNGDGKYGDPNSDKVFMGLSQEPKWNLGLNLNMAYKGFDFSMLWQGSFKAQSYDLQTGYHSTTVRHGWAMSKEVTDNRYFYDPKNPDDPRTNIDGKYPRLKFGADAINEVRSNFWLQSVSYMRLKNAQLGYTLPANIAQKVHLTNARVYISGENLLTITPYKGIDPETMAYNKYPSMKQFSFGINLTF